MKTKEVKYSLEEFESNFRMYWGYVHAICHRHIKNSETAKDMVQDIFLSLWRRQIRFDNEESLKKYLAKAAKFQVLKSLRDNKTTTFEEAGLTDEELSAQLHTPYQLYAGKHLSEQLEQKIDQLKEPSRTIFLMSRYDLLSHKEIAARMGIAVKTVEYHLGKALKSLREKYFKHGSIRY